MTLDQTIEYYQKKADHYKRKAKDRPCRINMFSQAIPMTDAEVSGCIEQAKKYEHLVSLLNELKAYREAEKKND